jgi:hypothetical protein
MDTGCTESRCLVKNGENDHKVPAMQSEQGRDEICLSANEIRRANEICLWQMKSTEGG